jgi:hypothetical protein
VLTVVLGPRKKRRQRLATERRVSVEAARVEDPFITIERLKAQMNEKDEIIRKLRSGLDCNDSE